MTRQLSLFGENQPERPGAVRVDPDKVRAELMRVLAQVRAARTLPWNARGALYWRKIRL